MFHGLIVEDPNLVFVGSIGAVPRALRRFFGLGSLLICTEAVLRGGRLEALPAELEVGFQIFSGLFPPCFVPLGNKEGGNLAK